MLQDNLAGYTVHHVKANLSFEIPAPGMVSVYRGWGPLHSETPADSFDAFLARQASGAGADLRQEQVTRIKLGDGQITPAVITTNRQEYEADFVIGAFGHNQALFDSIVDATAQPAALDTARITRGAVREYEFGAAFVAQRYGRSVHIIADATPRIWFAAFIPKGAVVSIVAMGHNDVRPADFDELFASPAVQSLLPGSGLKQCLICACTRSSLTTSSPRRFLIPGEGGIALIGDAGPTRPRKNGLLAAIDLAQNLAACLDQHGLSSHALLGFSYHAWAYYVIDDLWADALLGLTGRAPAFPIMGSLTRRALAHDSRIPIISTAMQEYGRLMLTGDGPYWRIPASVLWKLYNK